MLTRFGAPYTLRKEAPAAGLNAWTQGAVTVTYTPCVAREHNQTPSDDTRGIHGHKGKISVLASSLAAIPNEGDRIALGTFAADAGAQWLHVVDVGDTREHGVTRRYILTVRE